MDMGLSKLWELVIDREAWRAAIHGVTKSRTRLEGMNELNWKQSMTFYSGKSSFISEGYLKDFFIWVHSFVKFILRNLVFLFCLNGVL